MPRILILCFITLFSITANGQFEQNNKWSIDISGGLSNAVRPYTAGYWSNTYDLFHASGGVRYMFNNKYGIKFDGGFDRIKNDENGSNGTSLPFQTNYYRASVQGILDLGRVFMFENFSNHVSLLFHSGAGFSMIQSEVNPESDPMANFMFGFTPQFKLGNRVALFVDASFIWHIYQQYTFDMHNSVAKRGFDGFMANATIGFNFYLGKNETHMDWAYTPCFPDMSYLELENKNLDSTNMALRANLKDDDADGVINIMDDEKDTPFGKEVDCRGVTITSIDVVINTDTTADSTTDTTTTTDIDTTTTDIDTTTVTDIDTTTVTDIDTTTTDNTTTVIIDKSGLTSIGDINFGLNHSYVQGRFYSVLNETANLLKSQPNLTILLGGHADITGDEAYNVTLAMKRANSIKKYLISRGINESRIQVVSFGETKPKFLSKTAAGRALNRRVEVYIQEK